MNYLGHDETLQLKRHYLQEQVESAGLCALLQIQRQGQMSANTFNYHAFSQHWVSAVQSHQRCVWGKKVLTRVMCPLILTAKHP